MILLDRSLSLPEENLALDEALLEECVHRDDKQPREFLRFWESPRYFVVLGVSGRLKEDVRVDACRGDGIPILRRISGGGTVLQGPGSLNFSLVLSLDSHPEFRDLRRSYGLVLESLSRALDLRDLAPRGTSDLALLDRKISGNAQKRTRGALLHHGTILHGFDFGKITRYLREPAVQPDYRRARSHEDFVTNIGLSPAEIKARLRRAWAAVPAPWRAPNLQELIETRYGNREWTERF
jgi:lipoate-protein ligase A